jgi:hypothetical protein
MEKSNCKKMVPALLVAIALFLAGGFLLSKELGMICVIFGIAIAGWGAGTVMNSETPASE